MAAPTMNEGALAAVEACPPEEREHLLAAMAGAELTFEQALKLATAEGPAREAWDRGATEVCIQGGLPKDLNGFYYRDLLRAVKRAIPEMHVHAFSPMEID